MKDERRKGIKGWLFVDVLEGGRYFLRCLGVCG
jgi:hypothetical protein